MLRSSSDTPIGQSEALSVFIPHVGDVAEMRLKADRSRMVLVAVVERAKATDDAVLVELPEGLPTWARADMEVLLRHATIEGLHIWLAEISQVLEEDNCIWLIFREHELVQRRQSPRVPIEAVAEVQVLDRPISRQCMRTADISETGVRLLFDETTPITTGDRLMIALNLPTGYANVVADVLATTDDSLRIRFSALHPSSLERIRAVVARGLRDQTCELAQSDEIGSIGITIAERLALEEAEREAKNEEKASTISDLIESW